MSKNKIDKLSGLCVVTGASSGIGLELARCAAADGCDMVLVARGDLSEGEAACREAGAASVQSVNADLATRDGIMALIDAIGDRPVAALFATAGSGQGGAFLDQEWSEIAQVIHTNTTGTVALIHMIGQRMRARNEGRILVTGSIIGDMPGAFNLVYASTKAFIEEFSVGLAEELKDTEVVVSCLLPGATDTRFFEKADMEDTPVGRADKANPAKVARDGYKALLDGDAKIVSGFLNKVQYLFADLLPDELVAKMHRRMSEPDRHKASEPA